MTPEGTVTTLHVFGASDGWDPAAGLILATDGNFYGTTYAGGANGDGTVFAITPAGTAHVLHSFEGTDGANPGAPLLQATSGVFYGTTATGGANADGTAFEMSVGLAPFVKTNPASAAVATRMLGKRLRGGTCPPRMILQGVWQAMAPAPQKRPPF